MFLSQYSGLEAFVSPLGIHSEIFTATVRKNLTQSLGAVTADLSAEMKQVMQEHLGNITTRNWKEVKFVPLAAQIVARLSNRVFLGKKLSTSKEWLNVSIMYTVDSQIALQELQMFPPFTRWLVHWFMPSMNRCREHIRTARRIIDPEVAERYKERRNALLSGKTLEKPRDSISWQMDNAGNVPYDFARGQITLGVAAIHTTSAMMSGLLFDLVENPAIIEELRKEIVQVLQEDGGWKKTSLYKMKLLDSCMKESQRLHPVNSFVMIRSPTEDVTLSDGTRLPKNSMIAIPAVYMRDPAIYGPTADQFDGHRFLGLREQTGQENKWQFVTTSPEMFAFGHGMHACPGRFFASNEVKIAIGHLLLSYDWKFDEKLRRPKSLKDSRDVPDPNGGVWCKARNEEVAL
ncbi:putative cytochrome p450 protein [Neofusicoccum parvum]|uniref:Cytochrome p450 protein n=1 Tax=Neofusicoccum parvum TaxID=310453 RepID=A0ACB5S7A4_9PEZI|nr:putative cytochrome p450 protein [Neofusicoccum parvum]